MSAFLFLSKRKNKLHNQAVYGMYILSVFEWYFSIQTILKTIWVHVYLKATQNCTHTQFVKRNLVLLDLDDHVQSNSLLIFYLLDVSCWLHHSAYCICNKNKYLRILDSNNQIWLMIFINFGWPRPVQLCIILFSMHIFYWLSTSKQFVLDLLGHW